MPFRTLTQCCDCDQIVDNHLNHDCPNDPMKDPAKKAEHDAKDAEYERQAAAWDTWMDDHPEIEAAYPSMGHTPDEIAINGRVVLFAEGDEFWGGEEGGNYSSLPMDSPTWAEVILEFEKAMFCTGDYHHSFLEGLCVDGKPPKWAVIRENIDSYASFSTGS